MAGLTDQAGGEGFGPGNAIGKARRAWEASMFRRLEALRAELRGRPAEGVAAASGSVIEEEVLKLTYWGAEVLIHWPALEAMFQDGTPCSTFDHAILLYYLHTADGTPLANRWIGFRELPNGAFYHQAFQGYTGRRLARAFGGHLEGFDAAATTFGGQRLPALSDHAYQFSPLPNLPLAVALWPGDEEFPAQAAVLFDASAHHYLPLDGLALLGSGLVGRLLK